ncbi:MAG: hypothetical protein QOK47_919 [Actinomycetota bacterium]|nr:hypothetical protein [Actinomycetota bacterium]
MRKWWGGLLVAFLLVAASPVAGGKAVHCRGPEMHADHDRPAAHRYFCRTRLVASTIVSKEAGLGRIEFSGAVGAVLQRDEGAVAMLDMSQPARPKVVGRYDDDIQDSFDGDLAFSHDGQFLFYARQTHQFSKDGVHVLDVSDPTSPQLAFYQASGGTLRIAYYFDGTDEWVVFLDAVDGLVVCRFVRESGSLAEVYRDPDPALEKVGGPASAGLFIDPKDPQTETPLLYVSTGGSGLQIYDFSDPTTPTELGSWADVGLAEVEVKRTPKKRIVYAATEYWFDDQISPEVVVLDATKPDAIKRVRTLRLKVPTDNNWRVQGMAWAGKRLLVAHSHAGLIGFTTKGAVSARALIGSVPHEGAGVPGSVYAMDVERRGKLIYVTDASTGALQILRLLR